MAVDVKAYVDDSSSNRLFLLGAPALDDFLISVSTKVVRRRHERVVSVTRDVTGCRRKRYVLSQDSNEPSQVVKVDHDSDFAKRAKNGHTAGELTSLKKRKRAVIRKLGSLDLDELIDLNERSKEMKREQ